MSPALDAASQLLSPIRLHPAATALIAAAAIDWLAGEPPAPVHPVVWIGHCVRFLERLAPRGARAQLLFGAGVAVGLPLVAVAGARAIGLLPLALSWPLSVFLLTSSFALRGLGKAGLALKASLDRGDLPAARAGLSSLCSRSAKALGPAELSAATVESLAENTSDSVVAPVFFYVCFGLEGALAYRCVNTLDAMIGYHGKYEFLGKASARLDDALNWIPARLTALLLLLVGAAMGQRWRRGARIWRRDARRTESPNAGHPMAAMAGLLGVRLDKPGHYTLGAEGAAARAESIRQAWRIACGAGGLALLAAVVASA